MNEINEVSKNNKKHKINKTAVRVLEVLKLLISKELSITEVFNQINGHEKIPPIQRNETLNKYFLTLKFLGLSLVKIKGKYVLKKLPILFDFLVQELEALEYIVACANLIYVDSEKKTFYQLLDNLEKSFSDLTQKRITIVKNKKNYKIEKIKGIKTDKNILYNFSKYCKDNLMLQISYDNNDLNILQKYIIEPKKILFKSSEIMLMAYNCQFAEIQYFSLNCIKSVKQLPQKATGISTILGIKFEISGSFSNTYELRDGEKIINRTEDKITVINKKEDKKLLYARLLRYGKACRIIYPISEQKNFTNLVKKIKKQYILK